MPGSGNLKEALERAAREGWEGIALLGPDVAWGRAKFIQAGWPDEAVTVLDEAMDGAQLVRDVLPELRRNGALTTLSLVGNRIGDEGGRALATLTGLTSLDLSSNQIRAEGARALATLTGLTTLDLRANQISDEGARALTTLPRLTTLHLGFNQVGDKGARALVTLTGLTKLDLTANQISDEGARALATLTGLTSLKLNRNRIGDEGARALATLTGLTTLDLWNNQISDEGARALATLTRLTTLHLGMNQIGDEGARALASLTGLTSLHLSGNQIGDEGARALATLTGLASLDLEANQISDEGARALTTLTGLEFLDLRNNATDLANEILRQTENPGEIFRALLARDLAPLLELKAVILGDSPDAGSDRLGKTQLRRRLEGHRAEPGARITESFERGLVRLQVARDGVDHLVTFHIFDFGGQRRILGSHRFFLATRRHIYIICVDARKTVGEARAAHWLHFVNETHEQLLEFEANNQFEHDPVAETTEQRDRLLDELRRRTPPPPVLVVVTHARDGDSRMDPDELKRVVGESGLRVQVVDGYDNMDDPGDRGLTRVKRALGDAAAATSELWEVFPRDLLETLRNARGRFGRRADGSLDPSLTPALLLTLDEFQECVPAPAGAMADRSHAEFALAVLRDLGVVHWVGDRSDLHLDSSHPVRRSVFNPDWVKDPVYKLLWGKRLATDDGLIPEKAMLGALADGGASDRASAHLVLKLALACELVFAQEKGTLPHYIVPDQLEESTDAPPSRAHWPLVRQWRPRYLPDWLVPRLIGRLWRLRRPNSRPMRNVFELLTPEGEAIVHASHGTLTVAARGERGADLLEYVRREVHTLWSGCLSDTAPGAVLADPTTAHPAAALSRRPVQMFVCYARKDEEFREEFEEALSPLRRDGLMEEWFDEMMPAGAEVDAQIAQRLRTADVIVLLVSASSIASKYIYEKELNVAMDRHHQKIAHVVPVILRTCDWKTQPYGKLNAIPDGGRAISAWQDRDAAWTAVVLKIRALINELRRQSGA